MTRIGILGAAAVQADAVLAAQSLGYEVHVLAAAANGPAAEITDTFVAIDFSDVAAVVNYAKDAGLNVVYSVGSDIAMPVSAKVSAELGLPHFVSVQTAVNCNSKPDMRAHLGDMLGNIPSKTVMSAVGAHWEGPWPIIVKPSDSQGQRGVSKLEDPAGLSAAIENALPHSRRGSVILEEFIDGPEVSVNGYMVDETLAFMAVSDRETWPEFTGLVAAHALPSRYETEDLHARIRSMMSTAANKLGIDNGPVYAQVMLRDGQPYVIEITPRLDGCHMWEVIKTSTGTDLLAATLQHLVDGKAPTFSDPDALEALAVRLDFHCQAPNTAYSSDRFPRPADSVERYAYYRDGDIVRPVNGRYDKVGYDIRRIEQG